VVQVFNLHDTPSRISQAQRTPRWADFLNAFYIDTWYKARIVLRSAIMEAHRQLLPQEYQCVPSGNAWVFIGRS
jgi:hypothetical protein